MRPLASSKWGELVLVGTALGLYLTRCLLRAIQEEEEIVRQAFRSQVPAALLDQRLANYDRGLHLLLPVLAGTALLLAGWASLRYLALPRLEDDQPRLGGFFSLAISALLLLGGVGVYHYFRLYLRLQHDDEKKIIGLLTYSLYRKKTVLADAVAVGTVLAGYELLSQLYWYLRGQLPLRANPLLRVGHHLLLAGAGVLLLAGAWTGQLPLPLWNEQMGPWLLLAGLSLQVYVLHRGAYPVLGAFRAAPHSARWVGYLLLWLLLTLGGTAILWTAYNPEPRLALRPLAGLFVLALGASLLGVALRQVLAREKSLLQTQASHSAAELSSLRAQINPHFLFNALNSLYSTALQGDSEKTAEGIQQLGDMMRFLLEENNLDRILLRKEVEYLHSYLQLQRLRLDETQGIDIRVNLQEPPPDRYLAPMLLTPFVENAFNHGISFQLPSWIYVTLTLDATHLYFKVHNSLHPQPNAEPATPTSGIGLENVRKRLELLYPGQHHLAIQRSDQDYFVALTLPLW